MINEFKRMRKLAGINEMQINKPPGSRLRIIKLIKGEWGLLVNNKYLFARWGDCSSEELRKYDLIDSFLDIDGGHEKAEEYLEVNIPEPSFGGGGDPEEIEEAYDEYEEDCAIAEKILAPYSFEHNYDTFLIDINKISNINLIPFI